MPRKRAAIGLIAVACTASAAAAQSTAAKVQQLAPDVYFYEGDVDKGYCNNGWVVFEDYVLVIDANYPSGAREVIARIREQTSDVVVNGPYNFIGDGDSGAWIETLAKVLSLGAETVGPGHGPLGKRSIVQDQQTFFRELRRVVQAASSRPEAEVQAAIPSMRDELTRNSSIARYVGDGFAGQVGKVYTELTNRRLPDPQAELDAEQTHVAWHHGHAHPPGK